MSGLRVLNASHLADTGGNGIRTKRAFDRLAPGWGYRSTCRTGNYLAYPTDLPWEDALGAWLQADVVHLRDGFQAQERLGAPDRPTVIHHHGTQLRVRGAELIREQRRRRAIGLGATLDLVLDWPDDLEWMPALYDLEELDELRSRAMARREPLNRPIRVAHAPTSRRVKSTDAFLRACDQLAREESIEVLLIERQPWSRCLELKATADVYFDQVALGYGNNAIEAWGMGIPVIAGGADRTLAEMRRRFGRLPFYVADEGSIFRALRDLVTSSHQRGFYAHLGRQHVRRFHSAEYVVERLKAVYQRAHEEQR